MLCLFSSLDTRFLRQLIFEILQIISIVKPLNWCSAVSFRSRHFRSFDEPLPWALRVKKNANIKDSTFTKASSHFVLQFHSESHERSCVNKMGNILISVYLGFCGRSFNSHEIAHPTSGVSNMVYTSFFLSFPSPPAFIATPCLPFSSSLFANTHAATAAAPTSCITVAHAIPHI